MKYRMVVTGISYSYFILFSDHLDRRYYASLLKHWVLKCACAVRSSKRVHILLIMTTENSHLVPEMSMDNVKNLIKRKDDIEEQIKAYYDVLEDVSFFVFLPH